MSYSGKLFGVIPYEVRVDDAPYYLEEDIEAMLGLHYGCVSSVLIYVESVFNDDKHAANVLLIECIDDAGNSEVSLNGKYEYGVMLSFNTNNSTVREVMYAHQIEYAVQKHFTHDSQLTILNKEDIDKIFWLEPQVKAVQSAKDFVQKNKNNLDQIINSETPGRVGILIRAHLSGIDFTLFDNPSEIIKKIEQHAHSRENKNTVKRTCQELGVTQKELAETLGASEGTVRNWSSSNELPLWAMKFIDLLKENQKNKEIADTVKKLMSLTKI